MGIDQILKFYGPLLWTILNQDTIASFCNEEHSSVFRTKLESIYEPDQWKYYTSLLFYYSNLITCFLLHKLVLVLMENHYEDGVNLLDNPNQNFNINPLLLSFLYLAKFNLFILH